MSRGEASAFLGRRRYRAIAILAALGVGLFAVGQWGLVPYRIVGGSMRPTLIGNDPEEGVDGDIVLADCLAYFWGAPGRWDVVVLRHGGESPTDGRGSGATHRRESVKRVVGLPHETIEISGGRLWVDGVAVEPPEAIRGIPVVSKGRFGHEKVKLGAEEYFLLGDNSYASSDSRAWGPVPRRDILGRVRWIVLPPSRMGALR